MTVGMPGSGVGGLFYFVLVAWMPIHETIQTVRGRSSLARWRAVGFHWSILGGILLALWCEAAVLDIGLQKLRSAGVADSIVGDAEIGRSMILGVGQFAALWSLITLALLVLGASVAAFVLDPRVRLRNRAPAITAGAVTADS